MNLSQPVIFLASLAFCGLGLAAQTEAGPSEAPDAYGPRDDPHNWPDYGGTKDLTSPEDMGLTEDEIHALVERLMSMKQQDRASALTELFRDSVGSEKELKKALWDRREATNAEMRKAITLCRQKTTSPNRESRLIDELIAQDPGHPQMGRGTRGAVTILSLLEALRSLNTLAAYKIMIEFSPRHAGVFRKEIGDMLVERGLPALPALIYSRSHDNDEIRMFAVKWIRDLNIPLLSEQVKIKNPRRLAQLLEAYAAINELKALDVTLSLTNDNSLFVRRSARRCIVRYGRNAKWSIRRLYENTFSREPVNDDNLEAMLGELYDYFDTQRLRPKMAVFQAGLEAQKRREYQKMEQLYKEVLLGSPMFPEKSAMAEGFLEYGNWLSSRKEERQAKDKFTMAERLADPTSDIARRAKANLEWQAAVELQAAGVVEPSLYKRILDKDPNHKKARDWYERLTTSKLTIRYYLYKTLFVSFIIFLSGVLIVRRLRS